MKKPWVNFGGRPVVVHLTDLRLTISRALLGGGPLPADLLPFVPLRKLVVYLLRPANLGACWGNSRRVDWADGGWNKRANARWTNRRNFYSALAKRDYLPVDTPAFTVSVPGSRSQE